ncbi:MAG: GNAT family N-acetyltransferase [Chloroflexi bacterium]|nr:GNAT family N-acetyltransferase [Chloroflexota bacterium]
MPDEIQLRTCTKADIPNVLALWEHAATTHGYPDTAAAVAVRLQRDPQLFVLAVVAASPANATSESIVGSLMGAWDGWRGYMYRMAIVPELRRNGLATRLVHEVERRLAAIGATDFWAALGYAPQTTIADYAKTLG